jgi:hypothetical protein
MNLHRITFAAAFVALVGCSASPTTPSTIDPQHARATSVRQAVEPLPANGGTFGSGTITTGPTMESSVVDSTDTSVTRGGNMFGSGT